MVGIARRLAWRAAVRARSLVPERALAHVLSARSIVRSQAPSIARPDFERLLIIAPHPDDETIMCGGTAALLAAEGTEVSVAFLTDGEGTRGGNSPPAQVAAARQQEARRACAVLGIRPVRFLSLPDGDVASHLDELGEQLRALLEDVRPDAVALPWFLDGHPDHEAASDGLAAADPPDGLDVLAGEIWTPLVPNLLVDVSDSVELKRQALRCHETASQAFDVDATIGLNRFRSVQGLLGRGYAEAFLSGTWEEYRELMDAGEGRRA